MNWQPDNLENEFVKLIPIKESDFENLFQIASDPLIWEQHPTKDRYKREVFQLFFDGAIESKSAFLIIEKATGKTIGSTRYYDFNPENSSVVIGYTFLTRPYWGGGYNKGIKKLMLDYAFQFVGKVYFHVGVTNIRSQQALMNIGATKMDVVDFDYYGKNVMHFEYVIHKPE